MQLLYTQPLYAQIGGYQNYLLCYVIDACGYSKLIKTSTTVEQEYCEKVAWQREFAQDSNVILIYFEDVVIPWWLVVCLNVPLLFQSNGRDDY